VLHEAMVHILPVVQNMLVRLLPDQSEASVIIQKQILKIYFSLVQVCFVFLSVVHCGFLHVFQF